MKDNPPPRRHRTDNLPSRPPRRYDERPRRRLPMCRRAALALVALLVASAAFGQDRYGEPLPDGAVGRLGFLVDAEPKAGSARERATVSPDGKRLATVDGSRVLIWDVATGKVVRRLQGGPVALVA